MNSNGTRRQASKEAHTLDGYRLGQDAFEELQERAGELATWEKAHREVANQAEIATLKASLGCRNARREELKEILRLAPPGDCASLRRRQWVYRAVAFILILASFFFAHLSLAPFGLGWEAWAFCVGIALVAAFWTDRTLEKTSSERLIRVLCFVALGASLAGLVVMALLRGDILALYLKAASAGNAISDPHNASNVSAFYRDTIPLLQLLMALLAIGMELGSGMAVFEARKCDLTAYESAARARRELENLEEVMIGMIGRVTHLENEPALKEAAFYRAFYLGLFERARRNAPLVIFLCFGVLAGVGTAPNAKAQQPPPIAQQTEMFSQPQRVVILLDRTASVAARGYDGTTEYQKDVDGICAVIQHAAPGSHITVIGITDQSFSRPDILLDAEIPINKGPLLFQNRIAIAKARLVKQFKRVSTDNKPRFPQTDIFGSIVLASDLLRETSAGGKVLVIFSDMRNSADGINIENPSVVPVREALRRAERQELVAPLKGVDVYVLGVDGAGKTVAYWRSLKQFWVAYFHKTGAVLRKYSALRPIPASFGKR